jgi:Transglutaminase-like superfamily
MKIGQKIKRFFNLSIRQKLLIVVVGFISFYSYFLFKFFKHWATFGRVDRVNQSAKTVEMKFVNDIRLAIRVIGKFVPWENVCRHQAYQAMILCKFFKIQYQIFVGFKKNDNGIIEGHAWTIVNGEIITGFCKPEEYIVQAIYS